MSTLDYCNAKTQTGSLCKRKATCDSSIKSEGYCKQHFTNYYDPSKGKLIVNKISRVSHDKTTGLPMRYVQGLNKKEKKLYKKEIDETNTYYKRTGLVKGRQDVRKILSRSQYAKSLPKNRSKYTEEFEKRYGFKVTDLKKVRKLFPDTDVNTILAKGRAAYASGSRPSMTGKGGIESWSFSRLASSLTGGKASLVDHKSIGPRSLKVIFSKKYNK